MPSSDPMSLGKDIILRATGRLAPLRLVVLDATRTANAICRAHKAEAFTAEILGEAICAGLLLASGLKHPGTVQTVFRFSGDLSVVKSDATPQGLVRAMIPEDEIKTAARFEPLLSPQMMKVRKVDEKGLPLSEGIVEMPVSRIGPCIAFYLLQSEQTRSAVGIHAVSRPASEAAEGPLDFCGAFLVEAFPEADAKTLLIMEEVARDFSKLDRFRSEGGLDTRTFLDQLAGPFEYQVHREIPVTAFCPCSFKGVLKALASLPREELEDMIIREETVELFCQFCRRRYEADRDRVREILETREAEGNAGFEP